MEQALRERPKLKRLESAGGGIIGVLAVGRDAARRVQLLLLAEQAHRSPVVGSKLRSPLRAADDGNASAAKPSGPPVGPNETRSHQKYIEQESRQVSLSREQRLRLATDSRCAQRNSRRNTWI